jgi:hypothetical protein
MRLTVIIALLSLLTMPCINASNTTIEFRTGPFTGGADLGMPCDDINIVEPVQDELLSGDQFTSYTVGACGLLLMFRRYNSSLINTTEEFGTDSILSDLISLGVDKDTISLYPREINGMLGAVGKGHIINGDLCLAGFYVSQYSLCHISTTNETMMKSVLRTLDVTEKI